MWLGCPRKCDSAKTWRRQSGARDSEAPLFPRSRQPASGADWAPATATAGVRLDEDVPVPHEKPKWNAMIKRTR